MEIKLPSLLGDDAEPTETDESSSAEDVPLEPHVVLEGENKWIEVIVLGEEDERIPGIDLRLVGSDDQILAATTDEHGRARWDDPGEASEWTLETMMPLGQMRKA